mgnify:CR=1 FL=1
MTKDNTEHVKVLFRYHSNVLDEVTVETMWGLKIDENKGLFKLDSIPFYGPEIATDDEFFAEFDQDEQMLTYRKTINYSGNSIVLVSICEEAKDREELRNEFKKLNCTSEGLNDTYFSMEILRSTDYRIIKQKLDALELDGIIEYAVPCLSDKHRKDIEKLKQNR